MFPEWTSICRCLLHLVLGLSSSSCSTKVAGLPSFKSPSHWTAARKKSSLNEVRNLWYHGYDNYMAHAFPADELRPLSCTGRGPDWTNPDNFGNNDVAANVSLTLIDVLDTFVVLQDRKRFELAVRNVIENVSFDVNTKPQVFEITIRVLGGLLSGHIYASDPKSLYRLPWYRSQLLDLAHDLGERLLPAFRTSTGIPYARTNLRYGVPKAETIESCTAGAGSLIIEFGTLSRLTGDDRFENAAKKAFFALWNRRSDINLVGNTVNIWTGAWTPPLVASIGAGIDSFYEYALKWYIISGEVEYLDVFQDAYSAIMRYARSADGLWYRSINMNTGELAYNTVDSLSSFWPGLQVLAGDIENAIKSHLVYWNLWKRHSGMPEVFDITFSKPVALQYPLRPEFIESTYYLYRATRDSWYLDVGERVLHDIIRRSKVPCGLTGIMDLSNNTRDDRMESFVLSETLKYLVLLFDDDNPMHADDGNAIFTTEGHVLTLNRTNLKPISKIRRQVRGIERLECPAYEPHVGGTASSKLSSGIHSRPDFDWARQVTLGGVGDADRQLLENTDLPFWEPEGWCEVPQEAVYSYDIILSPTGDSVAEDSAPGPEKLRRLPDGYLVYNVTGIKAHIVSRIDGRGYDITKLGPNPVRTGQKVYVADQNAILGAWSMQLPQAAPKRKDLHMRFDLTESDALSQVLAGVEGAVRTLTLKAHASMFGADLLSTAGTDRKSGNIRFHGPEVRLTRVPLNMLGCDEYESGTIFEDQVVVVHRGGCTFVDKLREATVAGAAGVIVIADVNAPLNPSSDPDEPIDDLEETSLVVLQHSDGEQLQEMLDFAQRHGTEVVVSIERDVPERPQVNNPPEPRHKSGRKKEPVKQYLWLAGRPILNMVIMA